MKLVNENINDYLYGPSEEEIERRLENVSPNELLRKSAENGYLKGVKMALKQGADIHTMEDAPLRMAAQHGHLDIVKYLVERGTGTFTHIYDEWALINAIHDAEVDGHTDVIEYLAKKIE